MPDPIPWEQWRKKAQASYKKGVYTSKDMVRDWGFPSDIDESAFRIIFRSGIPGTKDRAKINKSKQQSNQKRNAKLVTSTDLAFQTNKQQSKEHKRIIDEASLYALEDPKTFNLMVEHGVNVDQYADFAQTGAPDDPSNKYLRTVSSGIKKTDAENFIKSQGLEKDFIILDDEQTGGRRLVSKTEFNEFGFPSEQGVPIASLDDLKNKLTNNRGQVRFNTNKALKGLGFVAVGAGILSAGDAFAAGDTQEGFARLGETAVGEIPVVGDVLQAEPTAGADMSYPARAEAMKAESDRVGKAISDAQTNGPAIGLSLNNGTVHLKLPEFGLSELITGRYGNGEARKKLNGNGQNLNGGTPRSNGRNRPTRPS